MWFAFGLIAGLVVAINGGGMPHKMKCLDQEIDMKDSFKGFMECATTVMSEEDVNAYKDPSTSAEKRKEIGMKAHKNMCIRVCQWKTHEHIINEDGTWNKTVQNEKIDTLFPEAAREQLKTGLLTCFEENSKAFSEENECASYKPFEDCMRKTYAQACKLDDKQVRMDSTEE